MKCHENTSYPIKSNVKFMTCLVSYLWTWSFVLRQLIPPLQGLRERIVRGKRERQFKPVAVTGRKHRRGQALNIHKPLYIFETHIPLCLVMGCYVIPRLLSDSRNFQNGIFLLMQSTSKCAYLFMFQSSLALCNRIAASVATVRNMNGWGVLVATQDKQFQTTQGQGLCIASDRCYRTCHIFEI